MGKGLSCRFCHAKNFAAPHHLAKHEESHGVRREPVGRRRRQPALTPGVRDGEMAVECWCRAEIVWVPQREVLACRTRSCGSARCDSLARAAG